MHLRLGVLFSGQGIAAATQAGVLSALEEHGLAPTVLAGVGAGAWVAGLYACHREADAVREALREAAFAAPTLLDTDRRGLWAALWGRPSLAGLARGEKLLTLLEKQTHRQALSDVPLEIVIPTLALPARKTLVFANIAPEDGGELVWTEQAPLALAIRAALSLPTLWQPALWMGVPLIGDNNVTMAAEALAQLGVMRVLVVDTQCRPKAPYTAAEVAALASGAGGLPPVLPEGWQVVRPRLPDMVRPGSAGALALCIQVGYNATLEALPRLRRAWGEGTGRVLPFQGR